MRCGCWQSAAWRCARSHRTPVRGDHVLSIAGSITNLEIVKEVVRGADIVVQMATTKEDPDTFFDVSVRGVQRWRPAGAGIRQLILLGATRRSASGSIRSRSRLTRTTRWPPTRAITPSQK